MRNLLFFLMISLIIVGNSFGQFPDFTNDYIESGNYTVMQTTPNNSEFGRDFTPRRALKMLFIFVNFNNPNDPNPNNTSWPANQDVPNWFTDKSQIYASLSDFSNIANKSVSSYYYEMSKALPEDLRFKIYANSLSVTIQLNAATDHSWSGLTQKAYSTLAIKYPDLEQRLGGFDNRLSNPFYKTDNSGYQQDNIVDYTVIVFRYNSNWDSLQVPIPNMENWYCSHGAYSSIWPYTIGNISISAGYTHPCGIDGLGKTFAHEVAHTLYDAPHYGGANGVVGARFFNNSGWGFIPLAAYEIFGCANAWERWYMGYINIKHDLDNSSQNGEYILRDYMTTGDAIRIKLPYVDNQFIWLENHQGVNRFDERIGWGSTLCSYALPQPPRGLMAYLENMAESKSRVGIFHSGANGFKLFNAGGNYDLSVIKYENRPEFCGNNIPQFHKGFENPYNGNSLASYVMLDLNNNGTIDWNDSGNDGPDEQKWVVWLDNEFVYGHLGPGSSFEVGRKLGISSNPPVRNFQSYNHITYKLDPIYLNGISVEVLSKNTSGDIRVKILFDDYEIKNNVRMCGNIIFPPQNVNLQTNKVIEINKSGTYNRTTKLNGQFINPTNVSTSAGTNLILNTNSIIKVDNESSLAMLQNSNVELKDESNITVKSGGSLLLSTGSNTKLIGSSSITIESGGYLCIESLAALNLQDKLSVINFSPGAIIGTSPNADLSHSTCSDLSTFSFSGNGQINTFISDVYIQNVTISSNNYFAGNNIYIGENVISSKAQGPVIFSNNCSIIVGADQEITLDKGFQLDAGSSFEIKQF
jgi:hypothetical protein